MSDSLIIANSIELLGNQAISTNPKCPGACFMLRPGFDLSAPQPTSDFVASLILDGERPFGDRASNRSITLPILITAPDRNILAAARETIEHAVDQSMWPLTWTRDPGDGTSGHPLVLDCFRAGPTEVVYNTQAEKQIDNLAVGQMVLKFTALPYGRSDQQKQLAFAAPLPSSPPPPPSSPVVVDYFTTINSPVFQQSTVSLTGRSTAFWDPLLVGDPQGLQNRLDYGPVTFPAPLDLTGMVSVQFWIGIASRYYYNLRHYAGRAHINVYFTFTDSHGNKLSFSRNDHNAPATEYTSSPSFSRITLTIPSSTLFDMTSVVSYRLTIVDRDLPAKLSNVVVYLDSITAQPVTVTASPTVRGNIYDIYGIKGTVHTPCSLQFQQTPVPQTPTVLNTAGAGVYTVPGGTAWLKVECVGGGGAGALMNVPGFGGGGGAAGYSAEYLFPASPGQLIPYIVGSGGQSGTTPVDGQNTVFGPVPGTTLTVLANGGSSALLNSSVGGLGGPTSSASVSFAGGAGRTASGSVGGGGASSGGSSSAGLSPTGTSAVVFTTAGTFGPGTGGWLCPVGVTRIYVECWGGGGSGATGASFYYQGSGGGGAEYSAGYVNVTPGVTYTFTVGAGGVAVSGSQLNGNAGTASVFTGDGGAAITSHPGQGGSHGSSVPGGSGGSGSTAPVHFPGGSGGPSNPYSGSGGSSAGTGSSGNPGSGYGYATAAPSGGGAGGAGSGSGAGNGLIGAQPGGGGGAAHSAATSGAGATGQVRLSYPGGAPTNNGAAAVAGGGAGGAGGGSANTPGVVGAQPGGAGGGGDYSSGAAQSGGNGGDGRITITPYASPAFPCLIVHKPALGAPVSFMPLVSVGGGTGVPNGATEYTMPQPVTNVNATFDGTFSVYLMGNSFHNPGASRNIFVTFKQYEYVGGAAASVSTVTVSIIPSSQITNNLVDLGYITLPIKAIAPGNTTAYYTVSVTSSDTADRFNEVILLDTMGNTVVINSSGSGYISYYLDEPSSEFAVGYILGSQFGRSSAVSVLDAVYAMSGNSFYLSPNDNRLFAYSPSGSGAPNIGVTYYDRYYFDWTA